MIDTGAWISSIRPDMWQTLDQLGFIEHLPVPDATPAQTTSVGGHSSDYRLGRLQIGLVDPSPRGIASLPPVPVIAQLLLNPRIHQRSMPIPILLGLHQGVLDGRRLVREPVEPRPASFRSDAGCEYGQEWYLETV